MTMTLAVTYTDPGMKGYTVTETLAVDTDHPEWTDRLAAWFHHVHYLAKQDAGVPF